MPNIPTISLPPEALGQVGPFTITNATIAMAASSTIIIILALLIRRKAGVVPTRAQVTFEVVLEFFKDKMVMAFGDEKRAMKFFPMIFTVFLFLLISNQFMLLPFAESIVSGDVNLFRSPASHYSLPIAHAAFMLILAHLMAFFTHPIRHIGNFIKIEPFLKIRSLKQLPMAFLDFFLGLLDIIGEIAKLVSVATRLFGNMFAGSIITLIIGGLTFATQFIVPMPFIALGILSGLVQAFVFAMLSALYISSTLDGVKAAEVLEAEEHLA